MAHRKWYMFDRLTAITSICELFLLAYFNIKTPGPQYWHNKFYPNGYIYGFPIGFYNYGLHNFDLSLFSIDIIFICGVIVINWICCTHIARHFEDLGICKQVRFRFKFSLITAFVAMITASLVLGLNFVPNLGRNLFDVSPPGMINPWELFLFDYYGFPFPAMTLTLKGQIVAIDYCFFLLDAVSIVVISIFISIFCEYFVRRQDRLRQSKQGGGKP